MSARARCAYVVLAATLFTGCASLGSPLSTERLGWVKAIVEGAAITDPATHPCVAPLGAGEVTAHRWVVVGIPLHRWMTERQRGSG